MYAEHMSEVVTPEWVDEVIERLSDVGLRARVRHRDGRGDSPPTELLVRLDDREREEIVEVEVRRTVTSNMVGAVQAQMIHRGARKALLVTEYVSPPVAERLRGIGLQFADAAGNMYYSAPGVLIWVVGRRLPHVHQRQSQPNRAFRASGLRVLFGFLADTSLVDQTYRMIAEVAGVSLGSVQAVIKDLEATGYIVERNHGRQLVERERLLDTWAEFYADTLLPKLELGRFRSVSHDWWRTATPLDYGAMWGGETAGALVTGHLRPEVTTVYAPSLPKALLVTQRLSRDVEGDVEIRHRFWKGGLESPRPDVVPAPLIYADLLAVGDSRCAETAELVRARYLV
jgi:hypothetical protein